MIPKLLEMSPEELIEEHQLSRILGKRIRIFKSTAKEFSKAIKSYIDSSNKEAAGQSSAYWPLVRLVKVYIKSNILKHGLVLVDMPGTGDSK
jgi:hypothetical protein